MRMCRIITVAALVAGSMGATGCGAEKPDNSPAVRIISPVANQTLPASTPIVVTFTVGGTDDPDGKMKPFELDQNRSGKGYGHVEAHLNMGQTQALSYYSPMTVPGPTYALPSDLIKPGKLTIELRLVYNGGTEVLPQRKGEVTVNIQ